MLIKHDHHLVVSASDYRPTEAKRHVNSLRGVHIHDTISDFVIAGGTLTEWRTPVRKSLCENHVWLETFHLFHFQLNVLVIVLYSLAVVVQARNDLVVEGIEAHLDIGELTDGESLNPVKDFLNLADCFHVLLSIQCLQLVDSRAFVTNFLHCFEYLRELSLIFLENLHAFKGVLKVGANMLITSCKVVMVVIIMLVIGEVPLVSDKAHKLGHVDALAKVLDVQA